MAMTAGSRERDLRAALEVLSAASVRELERAAAAAPSRAVTAVADAVRAAVAYKDSVEQLEAALVALPTTTDPATARAVQATENVWRRIGSEFGLLSSSEVSGLLGASNSNRAYAGQLRQRGQLLAARRKNAYVFPGFQFDREAGAIRSWVPDLLRLARQFERSDAGVIMWMMTPTTYLRGARPVDQVDDHGRLVQVAEHAWGVEW